MGTKRDRGDRRQRPSAVCLSVPEPVRIVVRRAGRRAVSGAVGGAEVGLPLPVELSSHTEVVRQVVLGPQQLKPAIAVGRRPPRPVLLEPEPRLEIRVWAVYAHDKGTPEPLGIAEARQRVSTLVERANLDMRGTGIRLVFLPDHDFRFEADSTLRRDVAITDAQIDAFTNGSVNAKEGQSIKDAAVETAELRRSEVAAEHDDRLLWLFSRGNSLTKKASSGVVFTGWVYKDGRGGSFSGLDHEFAALHEAFLSSDATARDDASRAVHETGHFFGLAHTHRAPFHDLRAVLTAEEQSKGAAERLEAWRQHAAAWFVDKAPEVTTAKAALETWDADRSSGVLDTPADPGASVVALANEAATHGDDELGPVDSVSVDVASVKSGPVVFKPDRENVMGYYLVETPQPMHFSKGQIANMRKVLIDGPRRRLVGAQLGDTASPDLTVCAVWSPNAKSQRFTWNKDLDAHKAEHDAMTEKGFVMAHQHAYTRKGVVRFDGLWNPGTQDQQVAWGWLDTDVHNDQAVRAAAGFRPVRVQGYQHRNDGIRYNVIYEPGKGDCQVILGMAADQLASAWQSLKGKMRMTCLAAHTDAQGNVRYSTVLRPGTFQQEWVCPLSIEAMAKEYDTRWNGGWRIRDITAVKSKKGPQWSAIFEKESGGQVVWWGHVREWIAEVYSRMWAEDMKLRTFSVFPT